MPILRSKNNMEVGSIEYLLASKSWAMSSERRIYWKGAPVVKQDTCQRSCDEKSLKPRILRGVSMAVLCK
jgi:hypothetical protein